MQEPLVQSMPVTHVLPGAQCGQLPPPQSMSVSVPFLMLSMQFGVAVEQIPPAHGGIWQSGSMLHIFPGGHGGQFPPQSTSVSIPFFMPSVQLGVGTVVVVVLVISGAQRIFGALGATRRFPNWSCHCTWGSVAFGHLIL